MSPNYQNRRQTQRDEVFEYNLFTRGKSVELTIYYNLAFDNLEKYIKTQEERPEGGYNIKEFRPNTYLLLREYLWKGKSEDKNTAGYVLTSYDKEIIIQLHEKLKGIRNFQSHYWHDNEPLRFEHTLKQFVESKYTVAIQETKGTGADDKLFAKNANKPQFKLFKKNYITAEGRLFFLSFFLNKGEMQSLLQISRGNKLNQLPEHKFKRKAYTYYCHREGATFDASSVANEYISLEDQQRTDRLLKARQGFRIMNYLKNKPSYFNDRELMPLFYSVGTETKEVIHSADLLTYIQNNATFKHEVSFRLKDLSKIKTEIHTTEDELHKNELNKEYEQYKREQWIEFTWKDNKHYTFECNFNTLYLIVLNIQLEPAKKKHFIQTLKSLTERRSFIYETIKAHLKVKSEDEIKVDKQFFYPHQNSILGDEQEVRYSVQQLASFPIGANARVIEKMNAWAKQVQKQGKEIENTGKRALNLIRASDVNFDKTPYRKLPEIQTPESILYLPQEFFIGQNENQRKEDHFLEWGGKYLMDYHNLSWEWATEQYMSNEKTKSDNEDTRIKNKIIYRKQFEAGWRFKIIHQNLLLRASKAENPQSDLDYIYFHIGTKAMFYLLYYCLVNKPSNLQLDAFIAKRLMNDVMKLQEAKQSGTPLKDIQLDLLEDKTIPHMLVVNEEPERESNTKELVIQELQKWNKKLEEIKKNKKTFNRKDKNATILDLYKLYDFSQTAGSKYFRKNEYQLMSVCHYMLNSKGNADVQKYIDRLFKIDNLELKHRIPAQIHALIVRSESLDDLLNKVIQDRQMAIQNWLGFLKDLPIKKLKDLHTIHALQPLIQTDSNKSKVDFERSLPYRPYGISPNLVLKYFDKENYLQKKFIAQKGQEHINVYKKVREEHGQRLIKTYYQSGTLYDQLPTELSKRISKLRHLQYETHAHDVLLWKMAMQYVGSFNADLAEKLESHELSNDNNIKTLFETLEVFRLKKADYITKAEDKEEYKEAPEEIYISLRIHQTDDFFYKMQKGKLYRLAHHFIERIQEEKELYKNAPDILRDLQFVNSKDPNIKEEERVPMPNGSKELPIELGYLVQERSIIANHARELASYLFSFEKAVVDAKANADTTYNLKNMQSTLLSASYQKRYADFNTVCNWAKLNADLKKLLKDTVRNKILHAGVPYRSFRKMAMPETELGKLLKISTPIGKDKTQKSIYDTQQPDTEN